MKRWQKSVAHTLFNESEDLVTSFGRHRRFWLITKENKHDVEKEGLAFVPQSTASDICMKAFVRLSKELPQEAQIRLSVYDSIMVEAPREMAQDVARQMEQTMQQAGLEFSDYLPFKVDIKISDESWGAFKD